MKTKILSVAVLIPLHIARAAMRVSVSMLSERRRLREPGVVSGPLLPESPEIKSRLLQ